jgi:hypothetical protein
MKSTIGKLSVFLLLIAGIVGYLRTGVDLFQKIKNGTINLELKAIDRALTGVKTITNRYPTHFKKFMTENFETKTNKTIGTDPWGKDYHYTLNPQGYTIVSNGPNHIFGDKDDVVAVRVRNDFKINVQAAVKGMEGTVIAKKTGAVDKSNVIEELMVYLDITELERPFEELTDEELSQVIVKFLRDYGYE